MIKCKLGDILDVRRGTSLPGKYYATRGNLIRLTLGNFNYPNGGFKENTTKADIFFTGQVKHEFILKKGDIITPLTEQVSGLLGETARIPESNKYIQSGDIGLIIPDESKLNKAFAYYLVSSPQIKKQLGAMAQQTKIRHTSPEKIKSCETWIPDLKYQEKAGYLLDSINIKINNNIKMSEELEQIIKTIFDYWFLQYEFPNKDEKPYKSFAGKMEWNKELKEEIPEGWQYKRIIDIENDIITGKTPSTKDETNFGGSIPFITIDDIRKGLYISKTERTLSDKGASSQMKKYIPKNSICVTCIATVGLVGITTKESQTNQQINSIICKNKNNLYYLVNSIKKYFECSSGAKSGNIFANMNKEDFGNVKLIYPTENILERYTKTVKPMYKKIENCILENEELIKLRDYLLPLLMNGQVGFKD